MLSQAGLPTAEDDEVSDARLVSTPDVLGHQPSPTFGGGAGPGPLAVPEALGVRRTETILSNMSILI